jgi:hypothetical protein
MKGCKSWTVGREQFEPTKLAGLEDTKGVGEGNAEAVAE